MKCRKGKDEDVMGERSLKKWEKQERRQGREEGEADSWPDRTLVETRGKRPGGRERGGLSGRGGVERDESIRLAKKGERPTGIE